MSQEQIWHTRERISLNSASNFAWQNKQVKGKGQDGAATLLLFRILFLIDVTASAEQSLETSSKFATM